MLEILTSGYWIGEPYRVGGAGAVLLADAAEIGRVQASFGEGECRSNPIAELAALTLALERAARDGHDREEVLVRTGQRILADIGRGRSLPGDATAARWVERLQELAAQFAEIRTLVSPGWVTVRAQEIAIRAILGHAAAGKGRG